MQENDRHELIRLLGEAMNQYDVGRYSRLWVYDTERFVADQWRHTSEGEARLLAMLMELTPSLRWMDDYLHPAQDGSIEHAALLTERFDAIASAWAEAVAIRDGTSEIQFEVVGVT